MCCRCLGMGRNMRWRSRWGRYPLNLLIEGAAECGSFFYGVLEPVFEDALLMSLPSLSFLRPKRTKKSFVRSIARRFPGADGRKKRRSRKALPRRDENYITARSAATPYFLLAPPPPGRANARGFVGAVLLERVLGRLCGLSVSFPARRPRGIGGKPPITPYKTDSGVIALAIAEDDFAGRGNRKQVRGAEWFRETP
jgi:hypothetical protein